MSKDKSKTNEVRILEPGELSNEDLLTAKTTKGTMFSEAFLLKQTLERRTKVNWRQFGHADQRFNFSKAEISAAKSEGKKGFENDTIFQFRAI